MSRLTHSNDRHHARHAASAIWSTTFRTLTIGFTAVARKDVDGTQRPPKPSVGNLEQRRRERTADDLVILAEA